MSECTGTVVIKLNAALKETFKNTENQFTQDTLAACYAAHSFQPESPDEPSTLATNPLTISELVLKGQYAILQTWGQGWEEVFDQFDQIPQFEYWARTYDDQAVEKFIGKSKKAICWHVIAWDGDSDPQSHQQSAKLSWLSLMNKTVMKHFVPADEIEQQLAAVKDHLKAQKAIDHWADFYQAHHNNGLNDSLLLKLTIKNLEDRNFLCTTLEKFQKANDHSALPQLLDRLNTRFSGEYVDSLDAAHMQTFADIYQRLTYIKTNQEHVYLGAALDDSTRFIENLDDHARGYSKGTSFIDFARFFMQISNAFTGQVWSRKSQTAHRLTAFDGAIYLN
ncbi:hypothetical protein [Marinicella meishanensis]|uniref:hypothetical protein n=1 Tax=Marinicella meishanensis TaxID=2873263 RepID=UPI001CBC2767|nr:hypothetical protein [Marinicella sp. NBU2979]